MLKKRFPKKSTRGSPGPRSRVEQPRTSWWPSSPYPVRGHQRAPGKASKPSPPKLPVFRGGHGLQPGVDPVTLEASSPGEAVLAWRLKHFPGSPSTSSPTERLRALIAFLSYWEKRYGELTQAELNRAFIELGIDRAHRKPEVFEELLKTFPSRGSSGGRRTQPRGRRQRRAGARSKKGKP